MIEKILYGTLAAFSILLILFGLIRESSSEDALASVSGGSQLLFLQQKREFIGSLLFRINFVLIIINIVLLVSLKFLLG